MDFIFSLLFQFFFWCFTPSSSRITQIHLFVLCLTLPNRIPTSMEQDHALCVDTYGLLCQFKQQNNTNNLDGSATIKVNFIRCAMHAIKKSVVYMQQLSRTRRFPVDFVHNKNTEKKEITSEQNGTEQRIQLCHFDSLFDWFIGRLTS